MAPRSSHLQRILAVVGALAITACIHPSEVTRLGINFQSVSAGAEFSCALDTDGLAYCWDDFPGVPLALAGGVTFSSLSVRFRHSCGVAVDGSGYCWGDNTFGQSGQPNVSQVNTPARVSGDLSFQSVAVGLVHTCGLTTGGSVYCWGANDLGELGAESVTTPCDVGAGPTTVPCSSAPVAVRPDLKFKSLSTGDFHTCAVTDDGVAYCWGRGDGGELGDGTSTKQIAPVAVAGGLRFLAVSPGGRHTCGITTGHDAYCWGSNTDLQLGSLGDDGGCVAWFLRCTAVPFAVTGGLKFDSVTTSEAVPYAGDGPVFGGHTCALTTQRRVYCWGLNELGQLGGSQDLRSYRPVAINTDSLFTQISAGRTHTCGLTAEAQIHCWSHGTPRP